jgi:hypothetical protein
MAELVTLDEVKDHLNIYGTGRDDRLELVRRGVSSFVFGYTGRDWEEATRTDEAHRGDGIDSLLLDHYPASALTKVEVDGNAYDHTNDKKVSLDGDRGILYRTDGGVWPETNRPIIIVSYTGGLDPPDDLKLAVLEIVAWLEQSRGGKSAVSVAGIRMDLHRKGLTELPQAKDVLEFHSDWARGYRR